MQRPPLQLCGCLLALVLAIAAQAAVCGGVPLRGSADRVVVEDKHTLTVPLVRACLLVTRRAHPRPRTAETVALLAGVRRLLSGLGG